MSKEYDEYLSSPEWKTRRRMKILEVGERCQLCDSDKKPLHVHHRTYDRRGDEHPMDLTVLCEPCHAKYHDKVRRDVKVIIDGVTYTMAPGNPPGALPMADETALDYCFDGFLDHVKKTSPPLFHIVRAAKFSINGDKLTGLLPNVPFLAGEAKNPRRIVAFEKACKEFFIEVMQAELTVDGDDDA